MTWIRARFRSAFASALRRLGGTMPYPEPSCCGAGVGFEPMASAVAALYPLSYTGTAAGSILA